MTNETLEVIKTRRVIRVMNSEPIKKSELDQILEAVRWAPVGGNQRFLRFVAVQDRLIIKLLRMISPGMFQHPQAIIVICADWGEHAKRKVKGTDHSALIDVGTAMQTMLLAAHSLRLGSGPVTSFNKVSTNIILNLSKNITSELMVCIGHSAYKNQMPMLPKKKVTWQSLVDWDRLPD